MPALDLEVVPDLLLEPPPVDEPRPLDLPPTPPALLEVFLRVIEPVDEVEVRGLTTEPATGLF
ncbi:hypothetical protein D3C81_2167340 [compost metagenome]